MSDNVLLVNSLLPLELFLCFGETETFDRQRVLWKLCLPEQRPRLLKAERFMVIHSGRQKKSTEPPILMVCWVLPKRPEKQGLGCIHYRLARFMAMRMKMLFVFCALKRSQMKNQRSYQICHPNTDAYPKLTWYIFDANKLQR